MPYGKKMPGALYVCYLPYVNTWLDQLVGRLAWHSSVFASDAFSVIKLHRHKYQLTLLNYPGFWTDPHPALQSSRLVDLRDGSYTFRSWPQDNPPILHRKELFIPPWQGVYPGLFAKLTRQEEDAGLYADTARIGYKRYWDALLERKALYIEDHQLKSSRGIHQMISSALTPRQRRMAASLDKHHGMPEGAGSGHRPKKVRVRDT